MKKQRQQPAPLQTDFQKTEGEQGKPRKKWIPSRKVILIGITILFFWLNRAQFLDFSKSVRYQYKEYFYVYDSLIPSKVNPYFIGVDILLTTKQSFVAQQTIHIKLTASVPKRITPALDRLWVFFPNAHQKNQKQIRKEIFGDTVFQIIHYSDHAMIGSTHFDAGAMAHLTLDYSQEPTVSHMRVYQSTEDIEYSSPGEYSFSLFTGNKKIGESVNKIPIGTTSDLFNIRNNRLLLSLTLYGIIIALLSLDIWKPSQNIR